MSLRASLGAVLLFGMMVAGTTASHGRTRTVEVLPVPEAVHVEGAHVVDGACCVQVCGHCSPDAHHKYRASARRALKCQGSVEVCMHVVNPACCGCPVEIPMCVPACCVAEAPVVSTDRGLLGRGIVCFEWPCCGYAAKVIFKRNGKIDVIYTSR